MYFGTSFYESLNLKRFLSVMKANPTIKHLEHNALKLIVRQALF
jgi:hypothetical protein